MPARGGEHERLHGVRLAAHVAEVEVRRAAGPPGELSGAARPLRAGRRRGQRVARAAGEHAHRAAQPLGDDDLQALHERGLARTGAGEHERAQAPLPGGLCDRERAVAGAHLAVERELAEERVAVQQLPGELPGGGEHAAGEREVEAGAGLGHVAGREVRGDAVLGEVVPGVEDRGAHAVARLAHRGVGKADDRERGQPRADVHLDGHRPRVELFDRERARSGEHGASLSGATAAAACETGCRRSRTVGGAGYTTLARPDLRNTPRCATLPPCPSPPPRRSPL